MLWNTFTFPTKQRFINVICRLVPKTNHYHCIAYEFKQNAKNSEMMSCRDIYNDNFSLEERKQELRGLTKTIVKPCLCKISIVVSRSP